MAYALDKKVIYYDTSRVCISNFEDFHVLTFYDCHNIPIVVHQGFKKTCMAVNENHF